MGRNPQSHVLTRKGIQPRVNCTHPVPKNDLGIFAMHCRDNQPMPLKDLKKIIDGPLRAAYAKLDEELAKPLDLREN